MRTIIQVHDLIIGALCLTKPAPSLGNNCAHAASLDGFENKPRHLVRLFYDNAAKADVYRGWPLAQETVKFIGRVVLGRIPEEEATDIFGWQAALACNWNGVREKVEAAGQGWRKTQGVSPMCAGQSKGLGTSDGDQQYVNGICKVSAKFGPSVIGTGSRSRLFLQSLTISPSLCNMLKTGSQQASKP